MMECAICGEPACSRVNKEDDDGEMIILYYCKEHLRGHRADESFF
jgi:hypothetical protein